jgi:hypothetical protein
MPPESISCIERSLILVAAPMASTIPRHPGSLEFGEAKRNQQSRIQARSAEYLSLPSDNRTLEYLDTSDENDTSSESARGLESHTTDSESGDITLDERENA